MNTYSITLGDNPTWDIEMLVKAENEEDAKRIAVAKNNHVRHCLSKFGNGKMEYIKANIEPSIIL